MDFVDSVVDAAEVLLGFSQELEMVDLILQNMNPWQRNHFVFSKRPKAMGELYALGGELSNSGRQFAKAGRPRHRAFGEWFQRLFTLPQ